MVAFTSRKMETPYFWHVLVLWRWRSLSIWRPFRWFVVDAIHSVYVDQWDQKVPNGQRNIAYLKERLKNLQGHSFNRTSSRSAMTLSQFFQTNYLRSHRRIGGTLSRFNSKGRKCHIKEFGAVFGIGGRAADGKPQMDVHLTTMTGQPNLKMAARAWMVISSSGMSSRFNEVVRNGDPCRWRYASPSVAIQGTRLPIRVAQGLVKRSLPTPMGGGIGTSSFAMFCFVRNISVKSKLVSGLNLSAMEAEKYPVRKKESGTEIGTPLEFDSSSHLPHSWVAVKLMKSA